MAEFDASEYMRAPVFSVSGGITLARALVDGKPPNMPRSVNKAAGRLGETADGAQELLSLRQQAAGNKEESAREVDSDADGSWSLLRMRLDAYGGLPGERFAKAARAGEILDILFGDTGLAFLRERHPVQLTVADTILKRIDEHDLQADIDELAGPEFLRNVRAQHERYDAMIKGKLMREQVLDINLSEQVRALQRAITTYAVKVCATVDEDDPDTIERARTALLPIVNFRDSNPRSRPGAAADGTATDAAASTEPAEPV